MNARREGIDFLTQSPHNRYKTNQHETFWQSNANLTYLLVAALSVLLFLNHFRSIPASLVGAVWDILVYLTPSRIVAVLDSKGSNDSTDEYTGSMTFQAKSEAMQRILGIDNTSFSSFFSRSTTLSGLGTALLGNKDAVPPGLGNWDNSCYQNSIIQGLASLPSFAGFLQRNIDLLGEKVSLSTHEALRGIIDRLNNAENHGQRLWTPPDLKSMSSWQQQDAQEYFSKVVDQIDHEVQQGTRRQTRNLGLKMAGPQEHVIGTTGAQVDGTAQGGLAENTSFRNPLEGLLAQRVGCMQCGWTEGLSLIPFNCLTVPLGVGYEYDIRDCLDHYMNLEPIEGVECAKCTLLRARDQLRNILQQIEDESRLAQSAEPTKVPALKTPVEERLRAVEEALEETDFSEKTLSKKCHIPSKNRVSTTKSRQAVIARPPSCFVIHVNRSVFDEHSGMLRKNYAAVKFPRVLDLSEWCLGGSYAGDVEQKIENWGTDPRLSMLPQPGAARDTFGRRYELRAVVTHYGRHENGHYICYRKHPVEIFPAHVPDAVLEADGEKEKSERWYRLSDEDVQMVSEENVMSQGGAFMLFYEAVETPPPGSDATVNGHPVSSFTSASPEDMSSITSTATDRSTASDTSRATSVSAEGIEQTSDKGLSMLEVD
ncbi:cysteine proteinase [Aspergillus karnatakaensis]|uniref:ubiquitin-specific protease UBP1 n=1 Tax=Aspergillus karnatakaensis TaxID=1810916 RepID=UPI003CCDD9B5